MTTNGMAFSWFLFPARGILQNPPSNTSFCQYRHRQESELSGLQAIQVGLNKLF